MQLWKFLVVFQGHKLWFHFTQPFSPSRWEQANQCTSNLRPTAWWQQVSGHTASQQLIAIETASQQPVSRHLANQLLVTSHWTSQTPSCSYQYVSHEANREPAIRLRWGKVNHYSSRALLVTVMFVQAVDREKDLHDLYPDLSLGTRMVPLICRRSRITGTNKDICCQLKR